MFLWVDNDRWNRNSFKGQAGTGQCPVVLIDKDSIKTVRTLHTIYQNVFAFGR